MSATSAWTRSTCERPKLSGCADCWSNLSGCKGWKGTKQIISSKAVTTCSAWHSSASVTVDERRLAMNPQMSDVEQDVQSIFMESPKKKQACQWVAVTYPWGVLFAGGTSEIQISWNERNYCVEHFFVAMLLFTTLWKWRKFSTLSPRGLLFRLIGFEHRDTWCFVGVAAYLKGHVHPQAFQRTSKVCQQSLASITCSRR